MLKDTLFFIVPRHWKNEGNPLPGDSPTKGALCLALYTCTGTLLLFEDSLPLVGKRGPASLLHPKTIRSAVARWLLTDVSRMLEGSGLGGLNSLGGGRLEQQVLAGPLGCITLQGGQRSHALPVTGLRWFCTLALGWVGISWKKHPLGQLPWIPIFLRT